MAFLITQDDDDRAAPDPTTTNPTTVAPTPTTEEPSTTLVPTTDPDATLPTGYTEENREQFLSGCSATTATEEQCVCVIDRIETEVPFEVYLDFAANPIEIPPQIQTIVEDCAVSGGD